jgi:DNA-binding transcriptional LysR family regulator
MTRAKSFGACIMNEIDLRRLDLNLLVVFEVLMTEGSVTRAAARLGRTQSAVSHALSRLRQQLGDPLLVKTGGGMTPSPYAQKLIEDVRPTLRTIQRIVSPPQAFDPATSRRVFRAAIADFVPTLMPTVISEVLRRAPGVSVEWLAPGAPTMSAVAEGQIDLALVTSSASILPGVEQQSAGELHSATFARKSHPAIARWGLEAWSFWPHVQVQLGERASGSVETTVEERGLKRKDRSFGAKLLPSARARGADRSSGNDDPAGDGGRTGTARSACAGTTDTHPPDLVPLRVELPPGERSRQSLVPNAAHGRVRRSAESSAGEDDRAQPGEGAYPIRVGGGTEAGRGVEMAAQPRWTGAVFEKTRLKLLAGMSTTSISRNPASRPCSTTASRSRSPHAGSRSRS